MLLLGLVVVAGLYYSSFCQHQGPVFNAGVGYMFKALAVTILDELQGKNVSVHGELITKISFLNGGMKQLMAVAENPSPMVFDTIKPIIKDIMEHGKPKFENITFTDQDLIERFSWNSTQISQFRDLHQDIKNMLKRLEKICAIHKYVPNKLN